jgi:type I restriction enzyme, S subunit
MATQAVIKEKQQTLVCSLNKEETKMTALGEIPESWEVVELGVVCEQLIGGGTPSTKIEKYWQGDQPWITTKWLGEKLYINNGEKMISNDAIKNSSTHVVPEGSLLVATRVGVGKVGINIIPLAINQDLTGIIVSSKINVLFLAYQLNGDRIQKYISTLKRGATIQGITREDLKQIKIIFPPLSEQIAIARILTTIQDAIASQETLIAKLKELKRSMMQHLFTRGTKGEKTKMTKIGEIPESWEVVELGSVCEVLASSLTFKQAEKKSGNAEVHGIKVSDMNAIGNEKYICTTSTVFNFPDLERLVPPGAIIFPKRGAAIATNKKRLTTKYSLLDPNLVAVVPKDTILTDFLFYYFEGFDLVSLTDVGTIPQLNKKDLIPVLLPLPGKNELQIIVATLRSIEKKILINTGKLLAYQNLFKTLLHELMSGERGVGL